MNPGNEIFIPKIVDRYQSSEDIFVFPSEIVAKSWRNYLLESGALSVLEAGRFISWDSFKAKAFAIRNDRLPINKILRRVFVKTFLIEQSNDCNLQYLIRPQFREFAKNLSSYFEQILPKLEPVIATRSANGNNSLNPLFEDLEILYKSYKNFLDTHEYFEPNWESARLDENNISSYTLLFPQILDDYDRFSRALDSNDRFVQLKTWDTILMEKTSRQKVFHWHPHSGSELKNILANIQDLLIKGVEKDRIAISVASQSSIEKDLLLEAKNYGIELRNTKGKFLGDHEAMKLFSKMRTLESEKYSISAMSELFGTRAIPWKHQEWQSLLELGRERSVIREEQGSRYWESVLRYHDKKQEEKEYSTAKLFQEFKTSLRLLLAAKTPAELKRSVMQFLEKYIDPSDWSQGNEQALQRSILLIDEMEAVWNGSYTRSISPLDLWLELLAETVYVPKDQAGISVYPYRVSAGLLIDHHFIININAKSVYVSINDLPFIPEYMRRTRNFEAGDLTKSYMSVYWNAPLDCHYSGAALNKEGTQAISPFLLDKQVVERELESRLEADDFFWIRFGDRDDINHKEIAALSSRQQQSIQQFASIQFSPTYDLFKDQLGTVQIHLGTKPVRISPSSLDDFMLCPAHWIHRYFRLRSDSLYAKSIDPLKRGNWIHLIFSRIFEKHQAEALKKIDLSMELDLALSSIKGNRVFQGLRSSFEKNIAQTVGYSLQAMQEEWPDHRIYAVEKPYEYKLDDKIIMEGKIDLILQNPKTNALVIIDFKTGRLAKNKVVAGKSRKTDAFLGDEIEKHQIFFYATLLQDLFHQDHLFDNLSFVQIPSMPPSLWMEKKTSPIHNLYNGDDTGLINSKELQMGIQLIENRVKHMAQCIWNSDLGKGNPGPCDHCEFSGFCRQRFWVDQRHIRE